MQRVLQTITNGPTTVEKIINAFLKENPIFRLVAIHPLQIQKIGGVDIQAILVFDDQPSNQMNQSLFDQVFGRH